MNNIFALSFSNSNFHIVNFTQNNDHKELISLNTFDYPFTFNFNNLFELENITSIGNIVKQQKEKANIDDLSVMVSIPLNHALQKKIALPIEIDQEIINEQVEWELSHYLPGQLMEYKVIMTNSKFEFSNYKEVLFVCIRKDIISNINSLAQISEGVLRKLLVENFALENFINKQNIINPQKNQILFNIDSIQLISHFYFNGVYYSSYSENINPLKSNTFEEKILKLTKEQYLNIKNLNEQLPFGEGKELEIFLYGQALTDSILKKMQENFSCSIEEFNGANYSNDENMEIAKYVEALGICC